MTVLSGIIAPTNIVTAASTTTLTNKTLTAPVIATIVNSGTLTLPTSTDTLVGKATIDTLTNKTLTAPTIASANLTTALILAGAAGSSGQVLTSAGAGMPTWTTPAAGAFVFISSQTVTTAVASVDFTAGINSTYDNYYIIFSYFGVAAGGRLALRLRQSTTFKSADYVNVNLNVQDGGVIGSSFSTTDTYIMANGGGVPNENGFWSGNFTLSSANSATRRVPAVNGYVACLGNTGSSSTIQNFSGAQDVAGVITGFQLLSRSGSNLTSGTVALYGIKLS